MNNNPYGVCILFLRTAEGRMKRLLAYIPNEKVRKTYIDKARETGLEIEFQKLFCFTKKTKNHEAVFSFGSSGNDVCRLHE